MRSFASHFSLILASIVLTVAVVVAATSRPQYCGPLDAPKPRITMASAHAPAPTPAPLQSLVVLQVESDKSDIQVGWAEN